LVKSRGAGLTSVEKGKKKTKGTGQKQKKIQKSRPKEAPPGTVNPPFDKGVGLYTVQK